MAFFVLSRGKVYQPVQLGARRPQSIRDFDVRWALISKVLTAYEAKSILDIGCAEGWLVRRAATDLGCFAIGVDAADSLVLGEVARLHDGVERMALMKRSLRAGDVRALPRFDVVICLNVVHHIIKDEGISAAQEFVRAFASRAEKAIIFEMGTSDEKRFPWADKLPEMPKGQEEYIRNFLSDCGLVNIRVLGETDRYPGVTRVLVSAEP